MDNNILFEGAIQELRVLFPDASDNELATALTSASGNVNIAAEDMLGAVGSSASDDELMSSVFSEDCPERNMEVISMETVLQRLGTKLTGPHLKKTIDPLDIVTDALAIYKNPDFDASRPLRINFLDQPAIDAGGPRREFYEQVFAKIAEGDSYQLFEGPATRLSPTYTARIVFSGLMKCVGKMVAHSIAQCGIGFPRLSPVCYWYLITRDVSMAISYANISDMRDVTAAEYISKIIAADTAEAVECINKDDIFIELLSESGCTTTPTVENKEEITQCIMCHFVINKRKVVLDQLQDGLQALGVLTEMQRNPVMFERLFVYQESNLTTAIVKGMLSFPADNEHNNVKNMVIQFIDESDHEELQQLLRFMTGASAVSNLGRKITVVFDGAEGYIFASTCLLFLHLPPQMESYGMFKEAMKAVIATNAQQQNSFNIP